MSSKYCPTKTDRLYKCRQAHTTQADWTPDKTPALWAVIDAAHAGTAADPIPAAAGMDYIKLPAWVRMTLPSWSWIINVCIFCSFHSSL
mgnify:CR=1 FL=1